MAIAGIGATYAEANLNQDLGSGTPTTWYAAIATALPTDANGTGFTEISYTGYARQPITNNTANFPNASVVAGITQKILQLALTWPTVSGLGGSVTGVGIVLFDALTSGNMGRTAVANSPVTWVNGNVPISAAASWTFQEF